MGMHAEPVLYFLIDPRAELVAPPLAQALAGCDGDRLAEFFPREDEYVEALGSLWTTDALAIRRMRRCFGTETDWTWFAEYWGVSRAQRALGGIDLAYDAVTVPRILSVPKSRHAPKSTA